MRALVTGAAGFIGRAMSRALDARGITVTPLDLVWGQDALDFFRRGQVRYDLAIHCAAIVGGRENIDGSPLSIATNLALDSHFMQWLVRTGTPRAVYFSSSAAYPTCLQQGSQIQLEERHIDLENAIGMPDNTYGWTKLTGEVLAQHAIAAGCRIFIPRTFSGYGEGQSLDYPFPTFITQAVAHQRPFPVWKDGPFRIWGDGRQVRDFVHVDDVVGAVLAAIDADVLGPVNICTGRATSFDELAAMVMREAGYGSAEMLVEYLGDKPTGVQRRVGDPTLMRTFYTPQVTLEEGIARALSAAKEAA